MTVTTSRGGIARIEPIGACQATARCASSNSQPTTRSVSRVSWRISVAVDVSVRAVVRCRRRPAALCPAGPRAACCPPRSPSRPACVLRVIDGGRGALDAFRIRRHMSSSTMTELWPPIPIDDFSMIPGFRGVGPPSRRGWPGATGRGAGIVPGLEGQARGRDLDRRRRGLAVAGQRLHREDPLGLVEHACRASPTRPRRTGRCRARGRSGTSRRPGRRRRRRARARSSAGSPCTPDRSTRRGSRRGSSRRRAPGGRRARVWRDTTNATDASPSRKPLLPAWNGRHASNGGRSTNSTPRSTKWRMLSVVPEMSVATTITSVDDAGVEPHLGGQHRGVARRAHRGDRHGRAVEVVALHLRRQDRRRHQLQVLALGQLAVALHVELAPHVDLAEHDRVDQPDGAAPASSPGRTRPRSPRRRPTPWPGRSGCAGSVVVLGIVGDPAHVGDVVAEGVGPAARRARPPTRRSSRPSQRCLRPQP